MARKRRDGYPNVGMREKRGKDLGSPSPGGNNKTCARNCMRLVTLRVKLKSGSISLTFYLHAGLSGNAYRAQ